MYSGGPTDVLDCGSRSPTGKGTFGGHTWACPDLLAVILNEYLQEGSSDAASCCQHYSNLLFRRTNEELNSVLATFASSKQNAMKEVIHRDHHVTSFLTQV